MADERKYYVVCDAGCKFESMTKEQILTAIKQATADGEIKDVDTGFVTTIKEQNRGAGLKFWVGTSAEYLAIEKKENNCFYILTDDTANDDLLSYLSDIDDSLSLLLDAHQKRGTVLYDCGENWEYLDVDKEIPNIEEFQLVAVELSAGGAVLCSVFNDNLYKKIFIKGTACAPDTGATVGGYRVVQQNIGILIDSKTNIVKHIDAAGFIFNTENGAVTSINANSPSITRITGIM